MNIMTLLKSKKSEILASIVLTTSFLSIKSFIDSDTKSYIDSIFAIILLGNTAIAFGRKSLGFKK